MAFFKKFYLNEPNFNKKLGFDLFFQINFRGMG